MVGKTRIFIGSTHQELELAEAVKTEIDKHENMEATVWDKVFPPGRILLETIENLPSTFQGAMFIWARESDANVFLEYGNLAAILTRTRVALCRIGGAEIPADLGGLNRIDVGEDRKLSEKAVKDLRRWVEQLPDIAEGVRPTALVHGYSGTWNVRTEFSRWKGIDLKKGEDNVSFIGAAFLMLEADGARGGGLQVGRLYIDVNGYQAEYQILNEITSAGFIDRETLEVSIRVVRREGPYKEKKSDDAAMNRKLREDLRRMEFPVKLKTEQGKFRTLVGGHEFNAASRAQDAEETWTYRGAFAAPSLPS